MNKRSKSAVVLISILISTFAYAEPPSSANYSIKFDVMGGGIGEMSSNTYRLSSVIGQSSAIGQSTSPGYKLNAGFFSVPDEDGFVNIADNCMFISNDDQRDTDGDRIGNRCDPDFNNDNTVDFADYAQLRSVFLTSDQHADLNGDNTADFADLAIFRSFFLKQPGPSGIDP